MEQWLNASTGTASSERYFESNEWIGDEINVRQDLGSEETFRIAGGNINGLQLQDDLRFRQVCNEMRMLGIDHLGLTEINIDSNYYPARQKVYKTVKHAFRSSVIQMATSSLSTNSLYKPGGTMSITQDDMVGRIKTRDGDSLGRWSYVKFQGKDGKILTVVTVYQVCSRPTNATGITAFHQQEIELRDLGRKDVDPRRNFKRDVIKFLLECRQQQDSLVVMGDFNEDFRTKDWLVSEPTLNLVDIIAKRHPDCQQATTYLRGTRRIDYVLVSADLEPSVKACGYLPFHSHFRSDHRFFYIDLDVVSCFGGGTNALAPPSLRDFTAKDQKALKIYLNTLFKYLSAHNFFGRLPFLLETDEFDSDLAERLDATWLRGCIYAGQKCRKKRRHWFSLPLHKALEKKMMLQSMITGFRNQRHLESLQASIKARMDRVRVKIDIPKNAEDANQALRIVQKEIRTIVKNDKGIRRADLEERAAAAVKDGKKSYAKVLNGLIQGEQLIEHWSKIKNSVTEQNQTNLTVIEVPNSWPYRAEDFTRDIENPKECKDWVTVDTPNEIEHFLRCRNKLHFGQAQGTPFTVPPLSVEIDWAANSMTSDMILEGEYESNELDEIQRLLLEHCKKETDDILSNEITEDEFRDRLKLWDERTTTSPSGLHLGHAKAMVNKVVCETDEEEAEFRSKQKQLLRARVAMINQASKNGYSYNRWGVIVNVVFQKEPGNPKIHRVRVIHLYEYDFGAYLAIHWRRMMQAAEERGTINHGQFGGRNGREARDLAYSEELKIDICLGSRKSLVNFDNDAASCYDRIIPSFASLVGRAKGLHKTVTLVHATTLQEARYKLKTALGISDDEYRHCEAFPIYGTGQGSTNSPIIWIIISSKLFDVHNQRANGATFCTPDGMVVTTYSISGFVDDSNCQTNDFTSFAQSIDEIVGMARDDAELWSKLLWISGGYLELSKCSYHVITFEFCSDGTPVMRGGTDIGPELTIRDEEKGTNVVIQCKSAYESHKTLGHYKAPAGTGTAQLEALQTKVTDLADKIVRSSLSRKEALMAYQAIYLGWATYVLPQCTVTCRKLEQLERRISSVFSGKSGYARTMPLAIRYGPRKLGGAGFVRLYTIQGEGQICNLLKHWRVQSSIPGQLSKCAVAWGQYQAGIEDPILFRPDIHLPHLELRYISSMRAFLTSIGGNIELSPSFVPPLQREDDFYIMDLVMQQNTFTDKEIRRINYCRLFLQCITASDITNPNGRDLEEEVWDGNVYDLPSKTRYICVEQQRPNEDSWKLWAQVCHLVQERLLEQPLGEWLLSGSELRRVWTSYIDLITLRLYIQNDGVFSEYVLKAGRDYHHRLELPEWQPTSTSVPVWAGENYDDTAYMMEDSILPLVERSRPFIPSDFESYVCQLPDWERLLLDDCQFINVDPFELLDKCERLDSQGDITLRLVGDGSAGNGSMSFGWNLSLPDGTIAAEGAGPAYGFVESSHRGEGYAFLAALRFMFHWFKFCGVDPTWKIVYYADNKSILGSVLKDLKFETPWPNSTLKPDWDLRFEIKQTIRALKGVVEIAHVKGHQDRHTKASQLSIPAKMNVRADELAGNFRFNNNKVRARVPRLGSNLAQLHIHGNTITGHYKREIRFAAGSSDIMDYTMEKFNWTLDEFSSIDWESFGSAINSTGLSSVTITKIAFDWLPTNTRLHKYNQNQSPLCPWCNIINESTCHVMQCSHHTPKEVRKLLIGNLQKKCTKSMITCPDLITALTVGIHAWLAGNTIRSHQFPRSVRRLVRAQSKVGWDQLLRGRFVTAWSRIQQQYIDSVPESCKRRRYSTGKRWTATIIKTMWKHFDDQWKRRNNFVHGVSTQESKTKEKEKLLEEYIYMHRDPVRYLPNDRVRLITTDRSEAKVEQILRHHVDTTSNFTLRNWLEWHRPRLHHSERQANARKKKAKAAGTDSIVRYFEITHSAEDTRETHGQRTSKAPPTKFDPSTNYRIDDYFRTRRPVVRFPEALLDDG